MTQVDPLLASKIVWLDSFITNVDRTFRNTNMLIWHKELWLIDHGASFYFHHSWTNMEKQAITPFSLIKDHVLLPMATQLEEADRICRNLLTEEMIRGIVALIPEDWLEWEGNDENYKELRETYVQFLLIRLAHSEIFLKEAQNARQPLI